MSKILVVDDEPNIRTILSAILKKQGLEVEAVGSGEEALALLEDQPFDLVVTDIQMPGMTGLELITQIRLSQPWLQVIIISAFGTMDIVIEAMRLGVRDFLTKPFDNNEFRERVHSLLSIKNPPVNYSSQDDGFIGRSTSVVQMKQIAQRASLSDSSVLLLGESGTGKEVLAQYVHKTSARREGPFIAVNCGAIPENLIESEFFGHKKGSFSGAVSDRPGKIELAEGGTLFLDEIGEMPMQMQVKLLRVLQERVVERVGDPIPRKVDFRLVTATHRNLEDMVQSKQFREDLFFRLNVLPIVLPPLREREEDSIQLAEYFIGQWNEKLNTQYCLNEENKSAILAYSWQGNIRELQNVIERSVVLGNGSILDLSTLGETRKKINTESKESFSLKEAREEREKETILEALEMNRWNKTKTANSLGISRRTLLYRIKALEIS